MAFIISVFLLLLINLWIFKPFFGLGLFGDDWLTIFRSSYYLDYPKHLSFYASEYFNHFTYLFTGYGSQDMLMAFLYNNFGATSGMYFILSYTLRVSAGLSIFFPAFYLTKNKIAAWFAVFFFLFSATGIETNNWVFNMPVYIALTFFNFFLYFYLKSNDAKNMKFLLLSFLFFLLTFISSPIRAHGLLFFVLSGEIFWLIYKKNWKSFKLSLTRITGFLLVFLLIYYLGLRGSISGPYGIIGNLKSILQLLSQNRTDFLFYPIATIGSIFIPELFVPRGWTIVSVDQYLFRILAPIFSGMIIIVVILQYNIKNLSNKFFPTITLLAILWSIVVLLIYKSNPATFSNANYVSLLLIGGFLLILVFILFALLRTSISIKGGLLITLGWIMSSFLYPWLVTPNFLLYTTHRYLIVSSIGISLLIAKIISFGKNTRSIFTLLGIGSIFLIIQAFSTKSFLEEQYKTHNRETVEKIWSAIPYIPEVGKSREPLIFYFEGEGMNNTIVRDSITFGFPPHMALIYKISEYESMPIPVDNWKEVESAVKDGESLAPYTISRGLLLKPISVQRVYAFRLQGTNNLINITDQTRRKLMESQ